MFGHIRFFEHFTKQYLISFFGLADYLEVNDNTLDLLLDRLDVQNEIELFKALDLEFMVITKGKKGANFLYKENGKICVIQKVPENIVSPVDTSGAGDAFFSRMLKEYAYCDKIDKEFIDRSFDLANKASREILAQFGSRKG